MKHLLLPLLLLITIITGCDDNKDNVENYSFPVLSHTAWDGQLETNVAEHGNADASIEFETSNTGSYSFTYDDGTNATGNFTYLVSGQIIIFQKTCKSLRLPQVGRIRKGVGLQAPYNVLGFIQFGSGNAKIGGQVCTTSTEF